MKQILTLIFLLISFSVMSQDNSNCKCCSEKHAEFDFWIGTWNVTNPDGSAAGKNSIVKKQDKCVLQENWTSAKSGYTGTSTNFYNNKTKQWEQIWIDNQGQSLHLKGQKVGNQMVLRTNDETNKEGLSFYHQITWTANEDGTVRQLWETFVKGKDVSVAFDGLYKKE
jgi:hypothetical protein